MSNINISSKAVKLWQANPVGWLQEKCVQNVWPPPYYELVDAKGEQQERTYKVSCKVLDWVQVKCASSKKLAKNRAAYDMCQFLEIRNTEEIEGLYTSFSNLNTKMEQADNNTADNGDMSLNYTIDVDSELCDSVQTLRKIGSRRGFDFNIIVIAKKTKSGLHQCLIKLCQSVTAVCYGCGVTAKEAELKATQSALEYVNHIKEEEDV